ncbi:MAG: hypothetical protein GY755_18945 [Chloroflexi bacterium]|nr:hypothetical protein [Chloroflexota bacterium]
MAAKLVIEESLVTIYELIGSEDHQRIEAMLEMYASLFPQYAQYIPRMRERTKQHQNNERGHIVHYWLVEVDGQPAGLRLFRYIPARQCGIAQALAVYPDYRKTMVNDQRLSRFIIYRCLDQVITDSKISGAPPALGMVNEVEADRLMKHYIQNGLIKLPIDYNEPIFSSHEDNAGQIFFSHMSIGFLANPNIKQVFDKKRLTDFTLAFLVDHYGLEENHPEVQLALQSIPKKTKSWQPLSGEKI